MAKKTVTDKQYRQMLAARQGRSGGRFMSLPPEKKVGFKPPTAPPSPPQSQSKDVGLIEALRQQRAAMGFGGGELEQYVIGGDGRGIRSRIESYVKQNKNEFDPSDPTGVAAYELLQEAANLSEESLKASTVDAKQIYNKIQFLRTLAQRTRGSQSGVATQLEQIIAPVEIQLRRRTSFSSYVNEQIKNFRRTLPERLVSRIPVVGKFLGMFLRQRREATEELERYSERLGERISERSGKGSIGSMRESRGGTRAADIPGLIEGNEDGPNRGMISTLGAIYKEVVKIRTMMEPKPTPDSDVAELRARESELEASKIGEKGIKETTKSLKGAGGVGGFLSDVLSNTLGSALGSTTGGLISGLLTKSIPIILGAITGIVSALAGALSVVLSTLLYGLVAAIGLLIGGALAYTVNLLIDKIAGTNLAELMFNADTWTFGDMFRDANHDRKVEEGKKQQDLAIKRADRQAIEANDIRRLPDLVLQNKISEADALMLLSRSEREMAEDDQTRLIRQQIIKAGEVSRLKTSQDTKELLYKVKTAAPGTGLIQTSAGTFKLDENGNIKANVVVNPQLAEVEKRLPTYLQDNSMIKAARQLEMEKEFRQLAPSVSPVNQTGPQSAAPVINSPNVQTSVKTVVNNYNDDIRIRDNEPTLRQMQRDSIFA